jgi:hypothetical protein
MIHTYQPSAAPGPFQQDLEHQLSTFPKAQQCEQFRSCTQGSHSLLKSARELFSKLKYLKIQLKISLFKCQKQAEIY